LYKRLADRWRGIALSLLGIVATLWLAATGQLGLYIHPRYFVFTVVAAVLTAVIVIASFAILPSTEDDSEHDHDHEDEHDFLGTDEEAALSHSHKPPALRRAGTVLWSVSTTLIVAGAFVALILLPPQSLSTGDVQASDLNTTTLSSPLSDAGPELAGSDSQSFTVADWAGVLRQGADTQYLAGKTADVIGFVTPDSEDPENVFYIARYVVSCCAVDAQPVGVPVYQPGWQDAYPAESWVQIVGGFDENIASSSTAAIVLVPDSVTMVDEPSEPYLF